jgi:hypothetical protein
MLADYSANAPKVKVTSQRPPQSLAVSHRESPESTDPIRHHSRAKYLEIDRIFVVLRRQHE